MDILSMMNSLCEFVKGVENTSKFAHLLDVMDKAGTPLQYCITEREVDEAIDSVKDLRHSQITQSYYKDELQREIDKNMVTVNAEGLRSFTKDYLLARNLLVRN